MSISRLQPDCILNIRDAGIGRSAGERAVLVLALGTGRAADEVLDLPVDERERQLWQLRRNVLGNHIHALAPCPACGARNILDFEIDSLLESDAASGADANYTHHIEDHGWSIRFRPPTTRELLTHTSDADALMRACLCAAQSATAVWEPSGPIPDTLRDAVDAGLQSRVPLADVQFTLECVECGEPWTEPFAIADFFWEELSAEAQRLLREVHVIAQAYGWTEREILTLSTARRQAYLDWIEG